MRKKKKTREEIFNELCEEIRKLDPTKEEIDEYAKLHEYDYPKVVSYGESGWFMPQVHDTWRRKWGGKMHIDLGYVEEVHLMLDNKHAEDFINFIKNRRNELQKQNIGN